MAGLYLPDGVYLSDGYNIKDISLQNLNGWDRYWGGQKDTRETYEMVSFLAHRVPYLQRAIDIRAKTVASVPFDLIHKKGEVADLGNGYFRSDSDEPVNESPLYAPLMNTIRSRLYRTETALCIYGQAYWILERNRIGANLSPRWAHPRTITPHYDESEGLIKFTRHIGNKEWTYPVRNDKARGLAYFWLPNTRSETGPGPSPSLAALASARANRNLIRFIDQFMEKGALKQFLLLVKGNLPPEEMEQTRQRYRDLFAGSATAGDIGVLRGGDKGVDIEVVGDGISGLDNVPLRDMLNDEIATALGVPRSLMSPEAANYATSVNDKKTLIQNTVLFQVKLFEEVINEQVLPDGLMVRFKVGDMEEMQRDNQQEADALGNLVDKGIMKKKEARHQLGLEEEQSIDPELLDRIRALRSRTKGNVVMPKPPSSTAAKKPAKKGKKDANKGEPSGEKEEETGGRGRTTRAA